MESIYSEISDTTSGDFFFGSEENRYRVVMLGHSGVGKSALVNQFMTSEYISTYDASLGEGLCGWSVVCLFLIFSMGFYAKSRLLLGLDEVTVANKKFFSIDDEFGERTISVQLDGQESELVFIDHPCSEMSVGFF